LLLSVINALPIGAAVCRLLIDLHMADEHICTSQTDNTGTGGERRATRTDNDGGVHI
jgi:hypothetical protein